MSAAMKRVKFLQAPRSDGQERLPVGLDTTKPNRPSDAELDGQTKAGHNEVLEPSTEHRQYQFLARLGARFMQKLEMNAKETGKPLADVDLNRVEYHFAGFPAGYALYDSTRIPTTDKKPKKGGTRRDFYLYGYPGGHGALKRYRSVDEFFPHLWWLCTDETADLGNCTCKFCRPESLAKAAQMIAEIQAKELGQLSAFAATANAPKKPAKGVGKKTPAPSSAPGSSVSGSSVALGPTPMPAAAHPEQANDWCVGYYLYRVGELVWVKPGANLALGMIVSRRRVSSAESSPTMYDKVFDGQYHRYDLQPLSAPHMDQPLLKNMAEGNIFPFLSFSTPESQNESLRDTTETYLTISWDALKRDGDGEDARTQNSLTIIDGSIFAAQMVDTKFTLVQQLPQPVMQTMQTEYNGLYLGGELLWVGDTARYRPTSEATEFHTVVIHKIVERRQTGSKPTLFYIIGDIYQKAVSTDGSNILSPPQLPARMTKEIERLNAIRAARGQNIHLYWAIIATQQKLPISKLGGRWYESDRLLGVMDPSQLAHALNTTGVVEDKNRGFNQRGGSRDSHGSASDMTETRKGAFGLSVPEDVQLAINFEPPYIVAQEIPETPMDAAPDTSAQSNPPFASTAIAPDLDSDMYGSHHPNATASTSGASANAFDPNQQPAIEMFSPFYGDFVNLDEYDQPPQDDGYGPWYDGANGRA